MSYTKQIIQVPKYKTTMNFLPKMVLGAICTISRGITFHTYLECLGNH